MYVLSDLSAWCLQWPEEGTGFSETVTDGCELACGCWELNPGPLQEQPVIFKAEPPLQTPCQ